MGLKTFKGWCTFCTIPRLCLLIAVCFAPVEIDKIFSLNLPQGEEKGRKRREALGTLCLSFFYGGFCNMRPFVAKGSSVKIFLSRNNPCLFNDLLFLL